MNIGIPKEMKKFENRVALTPDGVKALKDGGHQIYIEKGAGIGSGFLDEVYRDAGAVILEGHGDIFGISDMIYKVKEPLPEEYGLLRDGQILYAYLHLAAARNLAQVLVDRGVTAIAFETIQLDDGHLPLLEPMSEIAGRLSVQEGAKYLEKTYGGRGVLLGGVPGVPGANVVIIGAGTVGFNAAKVALGMGARVCVLDIDKRRMQFLDNVFGSSIETLYSTQYNIERRLEMADLVIASVLIPGAAAPKLIKKRHLGMMKKGAVIVDVAVDQGGCCETTHPTYHDDPVFICDGIVHYCVANMPGSVPLTATLALAEETLPYAIKIANKGLKKASADDRALFRGINTYRGNITHPRVAKSLGVKYREIIPEDL